MLELHANMLAEVVRQLKASPAVAALVPEQVFGPDEADGASEWARCVVVRPGKVYGPPAGEVALIVQRDAKVEMRAENQELLNRLAVAVVRTLNGAEGGEKFQKAVHTHSGESGNGPHGTRTRTDVFGAYMIQPARAGETAAAAPPPAKLEPVAAPKKLKKGE